MRLVPLAGYVTAGFALAAAIAAPAFGATATAAPKPESTVRIGPNEIFGAAVNGRSTDATIRMACFGQTRPGRTGHPLAGQQLTVFIPEALNLPSPGDTGARGRGIEARLDVGVRPTVRLVRFTRLRLAPVRSATEPMPTWPILPCDGHARVVFTPTPGGAGAKPAVVDVTLASQP